MSHPNSDMKGRAGSDELSFLLQVFQTPEPLSSQVQPVAAGQAELPQAAGQVPLQPTPVNTQSTAQAASPAPGAPTAAAAAVPTQVSKTQIHPFHQAVEALNASIIC